MTTKNSKMPINIQLTEKYEEYVCKRSVLINSPSLYSFPYKALTKLRISKIEKILFFLYNNERLHRIIVEKNSISSIFQVQI